MQQLNITVAPEIEHANIPIGTHWNKLDFEWFSNIILNGCISFGCRMVIEPLGPATEVVPRVACQEGTAQADLVQEAREL